jgi:hypothetical protein
MNGRLAKKIRQDMLAGKEFCDSLTMVLQGVLADLDNTIALEQAAKAARKAAKKAKGADLKKKKPKEAKAKAQAESVAPVLPQATTTPKVPENLNAETVAEGATLRDQISCFYVFCLRCLPQILNNSFAFSYVTYRQPKGFYSQEASTTAKG